jgi:hypothetical protein
MGKAQELMLFATVQLAPGVELFTLRGAVEVLAQDVIVYRSV